MNSAHQVCDTVSFCEIPFYKQIKASNQMATFTHFEVSFDFSDIKDTASPHRWVIYHGNLCTGRVK